MDFKIICRICLEPNQSQTYDIFTSYYLKRSTLYCEMLAYCTKLKPQEEDELPRLICKDCSRQLKRTYTFNILCEESDKKLRTYLYKSNINEIKDEIKSNIICNNKQSTLELVDSNNKSFKHIKLESSLKPKENFLNIDGEDKLLSNTKSDSKCLKDNDIKVEPSFNDDAEDSCWDGDDDNMILNDLRMKKTIDDLKTEDEKIIKKRGRKKKVVYSEEGLLIQDSKLPHQCDICGKFLSTKSNLKAHKICHTELRPYKCQDCPAAFRGHSALFQHRKVHTGETPYHCEYCPKQFSRRTGLVNHIRMHTGEKLFSCEICSKNFVQSAQLSIHMKRHKGDKTFLCQDCGKGFPIKADLKVHQRIHNGEKPYSCHLCTKTFATAGNLSIHVRIHNKEVRYHCKQCQRGFVTCSSYNVHVKRHNGQRDHHCECGKTFYTSSALKQHKVVHTGEKKYQCKICDRKFSQTSHLSRHFKRDHAKPNVPLPSSEHYRLIVPQKNENQYFSNVFDVQKVAQNINHGVKCEGS